MWTEPSKRLETVEFQAESEVPLRRVIAGLPLCPRHALPGQLRRQRGTSGLCSDAVDRIAVVPQTAVVEELA